MKLRSRAIEVAARIFWRDHEPGEPENKLERPFLDAEINGERVPPSQVWERRGRVITEADYRFLVADRAWAAQHKPTLPEANPREAIDPLVSPIPFSE